MASALNVISLATIVRRETRRELRRALRRQRVLRDITNPLDAYNDARCYYLFRFERAGLIFLVEKFGDALNTPSRRRPALLPIHKLCCALRFFLGLNLLQNCGDELGIPAASATRAVHEVIQVIQDKITDFIKLPTTFQEIEKEQENFLKVAGIPRVVGLLDATQFRIQEPPTYPSAYINKKGYHSINVQLISSSDGSFSNVVAKWPGEMDDSQILERSAVYYRYEQGPGHNGVILGDSEYPLRSWLLTPVTDPKTEQEKQYNSAHKATLAGVGKAIKKLKRIFSCLKDMLRFPPMQCKKIVSVCVVLHNIRIQLGMACEDELSSDDDMYEYEEEPEMEAARLAREAERGLFINELVKSASLGSSASETLE